MGGSLKPITCPACDLIIPAFHFLYRKEFRITVIANDLEEAYIKAQTGRWLYVTLISEALHYDMLKEVD